MPASTEQKVDFLLKKIGYTATKSGLAEDSSLSGTKKAPFAEAIPSPIAIPSSNVWADSSHIPTTPPGSDTAYVKGYRTANAVRMTADSSVSGSRAFIAYTTYNNTSSAILGDWIDTQFSADYIVKVYKGDPNSGGVQLSAAGAGSNDTWFFDYASGVLNFNGTQIPSGVTDTNIYIVAYRYIGAKGALPPAGIATFTQLYVSGISTFAGNVSIADKIIHTGDTNTALRFPAADTITAETGGSERLRITSAGLVGIGTVTPGDLVHINTTGNVGGLRFGNAQNLNAGTIRSNWNTIDLIADQNLTFQTNSNTRMKITSAGDVGIGTEVPINSGGYANLSLADTTGGQLELKKLSNDTRHYIWGNDNLHIGVGYVNGGSSNLKIWVNGSTERLRITTDGNIVFPGSLNQLNVTGVSTFSALVDANARLDVVGGANIDQVNVSGVSTFVGVSTFSGDVYVGDDVHIADNLYITSAGGIQNSGGFTNLYGNTVIGGVNDSLIILAPTTISAQVEFQGITTFSKLIDANNRIDVVGGVNADQLNVVGVSSYAGKIDANADVDVAGTLDVDGHTELDNVNISGLTTAALLNVNNLTAGRVTYAGASGRLLDSTNLTFNGTKLTVTGNAQITTDLDVDGGANIVGGSTLDNLNVTGVTTVAVAIDANGTLDVDGDTQLDDLNVAGVATFSSAVDINSTLDVDGDTQLDDLNVTGVSTFTALVDVNNRLDVVGGANVDQVNVAGVSTYGGNVDINANVDVSGTTTLNDDVNFIGAAHNAQWDKSANELKFAGNAHAVFGSTNLLELRGDWNTGSSVLNSSGTLYLDSVNNVRLRTGTNKNALNAIAGGAVELYYGGTPDKKFSTTGIGVSIHNGIGNTATLAGPSNLIIDPGVVGDDTGSVRIKGDLYVDGTNFTVASGTIELADHVVGIATTSGTNAILDGGGIGIGSDNIRKTFVWNNATAALKSSEHLDIATGKVYKINGDNVLSSDTLGTNILYSSLQTVGVLRGLNVSGVSTFAGNIDANGALDVDGNTTLDNLVVAEAANIVGGLTADQLNVTGVSTYGGVVDINNNVTISGTLDVDGDTQVDDLNVAGVATFSAAIDANGTLDVDGDTQLDDLNVSGVSTFLSLVDVNNRIDVAGGANIDQLNLTGVSTFAGTIDANGNLDVDGQTDLDVLNVAETATFSSLIDANARLDVVGGANVDQVNVTGVSTFAGTIDANGNLDVDGQTDLDVLNVAETATFSALVDVNNRLDVVGGANIDQANVSGISTLAQLKMGSVSVTHIRDEDNMSSDSDTSLATQQSIKAYVDSQVTAQDLDVTSDSGTIAIDLDSETLDIAGTANEIETSASGNEVTIGLPNAVTIIDTTISGGLGVTGVSTFTGTIDANGLIDADGGANIVGGATIDQANVTGVSTFTGTIDANGLIDADGGANIVGGLTVDQVNATGISTLAQLKMGSVTATSILDEDNLGSDSDVALATQQSIKAYVDSQVTAQDLDFQADSGGALSIDLDSETLTIAGTANEIETAGSGNQVTIGLPNAVTIIDTTISGGLSVTGVSTFASDIVIPDKIVHSGDTDTAIRFSDADTIKVETGGTQRMLISSDGNVAIGNQSGPDRKLHITDAVVPYIRTTLNDATVSAGNTFGAWEFEAFDITGIPNNMGILAKIDCIANGDFDGTTSRGADLRFFTSSTYPVSATEKMRIDSDGNVNIAQTLNVTGVSTFAGATDSNGGANIAGGATIDQINATGISTLAQLKMGSVTATAILDEDNLGSDSDTSLATQQSIKAYVDSQVTAQDLDFQADSGGALSIDLDSETLGIIGTSNEIETSGSGNNVTIGLPNAVTILDATISGLNVSGVTTTTNLHVGSAGTTITTNNATSRVGINSTSPAYMLDVGGIINSSTDVRINGTSVVDQALNDAVAMAIALG